MKTMLIALLVGIICLLTAGCVSRAASKSNPEDAKLIQQACEAVLPATFTGPAKFTHHNQYFEIEIEAEGLRRVDGAWSFTWLHYKRTSHFPIFSGLTWSSTGEITLGKRE